jgi:hypothetical protein
MPSLTTRRKAPMTSSSRNKRSAARVVRLRATYAALMPNARRGMFAARRRSFLSSGSAGRERDWLGAQRAMGIARASAMAFPFWAGKR